MAVNVLGVCHWKLFPNFAPGAPLQTVVTTTVVAANYTAATEGLTSLPFGHTSLPSHVVPPPVVSISINSDDSPPYLNGCIGIDKVLYLNFGMYGIREMHQVKLCSISGARRSLWIMDWAGESWWLASCSYAITSLLA
ncbi:hypothetical protein D8674_011837 [Pyrus ussuriensis x Pyrus communis]|uniref:Uncharacterized protein n=1 Tax=Pyrus ussuriensis x Pyrus communis TaxID=2448454 RepID=A0A5N5FZU1_9ROSA|nr:hypothetical protein D8674_011837 [Pyrus ussuriensis x Pyrus communis]